MLCLYLASKKQLKLITNFKGLHPFKFDCGDVLGIILAQQRSSSSQSGSGRHNCVDHDNTDQLCQCCPSQDILHEVNWYLSVRLFLYGVWGYGWICLCWVYRQENTVEEKQIWSHEESNGGETARSGQTDGDAGSQFSWKWYKLLYRQTWPTSSRSWITEQTIQTGSITIHYQFLEPSIRQLHFFSCRPSFSCILVVWWHVQ